MKEKSEVMYIVSCSGENVADDGLKDLDDRQRFIAGKRKTVEIVPLFVNSPDTRE